MTVDLDKPIAGLEARGDSAKRRQIIDGACRMFLSQGFDAASMGAIAREAGVSKGKPYTPGNVLATMYRHLGIDPITTIPDHQGRPMYVLDDRELVKELI